MALPVVVSFFARNLAAKLSSHKGRPLAMAHTEPPGSPTVTVVKSLAPAGPDLLLGEPQLLQPLLLLLLPSTTCTSEDRNA
jgi:hypothetical protein